MLYKCATCNYITKNKSNYNRHCDSKKHINKNTHKCSYCDEIFTKLDEFGKHEKDCIERTLRNKNFEISIKEKEIELKNSQIDRRDDRIKYCENDIGYFKELLLQSALNNNKQSTMFNDAMLFLAHVRHEYRIEDKPKNQKKMSEKMSEKISKKTRKNTKT